jgi:hypothetical protein
MEETDLNLLRDSLAKLIEEGLETEWQERAYTSEAVNAVVARLQALLPDDKSGKLRVAGFTLQPYKNIEEEISQACETCMYYVTHRQFCDLPELKLPVLPEWSCRLWRI